MPRFILLLALLILPAFAWAEDAPSPAPGTAATVPTPADVFTVQGVAVDIKGQNAGKARDKAFSDGSRRAFDMLTQKLSAAGKVDIKKLDDSTIQGMVKSFEVEKEKAATSHYVATLTFHFKPNAVRGFFEGRGISISEDPTLAAKPADADTANVDKPLILVLPIMRLPDHNILFEEQTAWNRAWQNYISDNPQSDMVVAEGNLEDIHSITVAEALAGLRPPLQKMMRLYNAKSVLIPTLQSPTAQPMPVQDLTIQVARFDANGMLLGTYSVPLYAEKMKKSAESWLQAGVGASIGTLRDAMQKSAPVASAPASGTQNPSGNGTVTQLTLNVPFTFEQDWPNASGAVQDIAGVTQFDTLNLSRTRGTVRVSYKGSRADFEKALGEKGYQLVTPAVADGTFLLLPMGQTIGAVPTAARHQPGLAAGAAPQAVFTTTYPPGTLARPSVPHMVQQPLQPTIIEAPDDEAPDSGNAQE